MSLLLDLLCSWSWFRLFDSVPVSVNSRKDKSLRVMSQKFVILFLVSDTRVVSLEVAAKILIGEDPAADQDKNKFKSEFRGPCFFSITGGGGGTSVTVLHVMLTTSSCCVLIA